VYGSLSLVDVRQRLKPGARLGRGHRARVFQSNHEGALVNRIQAGHGTGLASGILNPAGLTQFSVSVAAAIKAVHYPVIEVHLTNLHRREEWRQHSIISPAALGVLQGLGWHGYGAALRYRVAHARCQT
jgi:3-dehydroquinate dehydratase II